MPEDTVIPPAPMVQGPFKMAVTWKEETSDEERQNQVDLIRNMIGEFNKMAEANIIPECFEGVIFKRI